MFSAIRSRGTFSNVVSLMALFVALGGTAFAASQLAKNSVGSKQIKNGSATGKDVKNNSLKGKDIKEASLGEVPSAASADIAASAESLDGASITEFVVKIPDGTADQQVFDVGGFTLTASCTGDNVEDLILDTTSLTTAVSADANGNVGAFFSRNNGIEDNSISLDEDGATDNDRGQATFTAAESDGTTVLTGTVAFDDPNSFNAEDTCAVWGNVIG